MQIDFCALRASVLPAPSARFRFTCFSLVVVGAGEVVAALRVTSVLDFSNTNGPKLVLS